MEKQQHKWLRWGGTLLLLLGGSLLIAACSSEEEGGCDPLSLYCENAVKASVSYSGDLNLTLNSSVTLDASDSIYDTLEWLYNGIPITECENEDQCTITMSDLGTVSIEVVAATEADGTLVGEANGDDTQIDFTISCGTIGSTLEDGILIREEADACTIMEPTDRTPTCRAGSAYAGCVTETIAASLCPGGSTVGSTYYQPDFTEYALMHAVGTSFCQVASGDCLSDVTTQITTIAAQVLAGTTVTATVSLPALYWLRGGQEGAVGALTDVSGTFATISASSGATALGIALNLTAEGSLRCVRQIP